MKLKEGITVPTWLVTGLDQEARKRVEAGYRDAAWLLRRMREHYEHELEGLYKAADECLTHEEYLYGAAKRKAYRELLRAFPQDN
jgi:hypothetical protein